MSGALAVITVLAVALLFGGVTARSVFGERSWLALLAAAPALGLLALLLFWSYLLPWGLKVAAIGAPLGLLALSGYAYLVEVTSRELSWPKLPGLAWAYLLVSGLWIAFRVLFGQSIGMVVDEDFFIHAANIGLFAEGNFPPVNPFLGTPMHGHFGRDLLLGALAYYSGGEFLVVEWVTTLAVVLTTFLLLFAWVERDTESSLTAALVSGLVFFASNMGPNVGLADTLANNNPLAMLAVVTASYAIFASQDFGRGPSLVMAGLFLGVDALIYETHFGLLAICLLGLALYTQELKTAGITLVVAGLIACTAGGVLTELTARKLGQTPPLESTSAQKVELTFPKERILEIRMDNLRPSRPFETKFRPWGADFTASDDYVNLWSPRLLNVLWYPAWLLPFTLAWGFFRGDHLTLWFAGLGLSAALVPATVGFGYFEGEATRWLFITAVGGAGALGAALGNFMAHSERRPLAYALLTLVVFFNTPGLSLDVQDTLAAYRAPGTALPVGRPGLIPEGGILPPVEGLVLHHYGLSADHRAAARYLNQNSGPEARFAVDWQELKINARGLLVGWVGRLPAPLEAPPEGSDNANLYRNSETVEEALRQADVKTLLELGVSWVLLLNRANQEVWGEPTQRFGEVAVYRLKAAYQPSF